MTEDDASTEKQRTTPRPAQPRPKTVEEAEAALRLAVRDYNRMVDGIQDSAHRLGKISNEEASRALSSACKAKDQALVDITKRKLDNLSRLNVDEAKELKAARDAIKGKYARLRRMEAEEADVFRARAHADYDKVRLPVEEDLAAKLANIKSWVEGEITEAQKLHAAKFKAATDELDAAKRAEAERQARGESSGLRTESREQKKGSSHATER